MYGKKKRVERTHAVDQLVTSLVEYVEQRGGTIIVPSLSSSSSSSSISEVNSRSILNSSPDPNRTTDYLRNALLTEQHRHDKWALRVTLACDNGHIWSSKIGNLIVNKTWCRQCALNKRTIDENVRMKYNNHSLIA